MFGGVLAGALKVVAVAATTAAIGGGIYLLAQTSDDDSSSSTLQAPEASATVDITATAVVPTPTPVPSQPTATSSEIDTSNWNTYESKYGFSIKYPPDWVLQRSASPDPGPEGIDLGESVWLMNPLFANASAEAQARHGGPSEFEPPQGGIKIEISVIQSSASTESRFDPVVLKSVCQEARVSPDDPAGAFSAQDTTVSASPAVECQLSDAPEQPPYIPMGAVARRSRVADH